MKYAVLLMCCLTVSVAATQTKPTPQEFAQWEKDTNNGILETTVCKKITWLLESERGTAKDPIHSALGWWGRGFISGAVYMIGGEKADKKAGDFGLSVDVVAAHIATYCYAHDTGTPFDAIQDLLLKVLK